MISLYQNSLEDLRSSRLAKSCLRCGTAAAAVLAFGAIVPGVAQADECGSPASGTVTCTAAPGPGVDGNPYPNGVTYIFPPGPLTINLNADTFINPTGDGIGVLAIGDTAIALNGAAGSRIITTGNGFGVLLGTTTAAISSTTGIVRTAGINQTAVFLSTDSGTATIVGRDTMTTGAGAIGLSAFTGSGAINITSGTVTTTGNGANAVDGQANAGANVTINGGTISTQGTSSVGINAQTTGAGTARVLGGTVTTAGTNAYGVVVRTANGAATATPVSVTTTGTGADAIRVTAQNGTATAGATTISTTGANARGIVITGAQGATVNYGSITTTGAGSTGILVPQGVLFFGPVATPTATITGTGPIATTGAGADGISVTTAGNLTVNAGTVSATGLGSRGIFATSTAGAVNVTSTGVVANGNAVTANNTGGAASVVLSGTNNSVVGSGAVISGSTTASLNLNSGTLNGVFNGATVTSVTGSTVTNAGTITGTNSALTVNGGAATINNNAAGTITGRILLTDNADTVANAGTFNATSTTLLGGGADAFNNSGTFNANNSGALAVDFGAGTDVFNSTGTFRVLPTAIVAGSSTLANLETFNNNGGLVDFRNGHTGDVLTLANGANYVGSGNARLAIDVGLNTTPTTTDLLVIGGAATGSTAVTINRLGTPAVLSMAAGTTFVDAGAASGVNAFVIAPGSQVDGVIQYGVVYNPVTFNYALVSAPSAAAYRTALYGDGVRNLWLQSGDAWTAQMRSARDNIAANGPGGSGGRFWFQGFGQWEKRERAQTVAFNGITSNVDMGYDQDYYGFQLGMDLGAPVGDEGGFNFGVTAGYQSSNMSFASNTVADRIHFNVVNGGLYASFNSGIFFINALGKYDHYWGDTTSPSGLYGFDISGGVWGAKAEAGLRFGTSFFVEPAVSVSWTNSDFDSFTVPSGSFAINDEDGLRGKAGARFGTTFDTGSAKVTVYGGANYVREFRGRSNVVFTSGGQVAAFSSPRNADYGEGTLGVNIGSDAGKLSGFFEGRYAQGNDYDGYGVRGGVRVRF